jgi:hypothetical protein
MPTEVRYVGPEYFEGMSEPLAGGHTDGESEAAAVFVGWIESGFPAEVKVMEWANQDGHGVGLMRASDLVESAVRLLTVPLPMPEELAAKVREYVSAVPIPRDSEDEEALTWVGGIWDLKHALAWRQEHEVVNAAGVSTPTV